MKNKRNILAVIVLLALLALAGVILINSNKTPNNEKIEKDNEEVNEEISSIKTDAIIDNLQVLDSGILLTSLGLTEEEVKDYIGKIPVYNEPNGTLYIAIKPEKDTKDRVKNSLDIYIDNLKSKLKDEENITDDEQQTTENNTNNQELQLLENMIKEEYNGYYIYVSGKDQDKIFDILKKRVK